MVGLRILHMIPGFFPITKGGAEIFALNLCKKLLDKGHKVVLLTRNLKLPQKAQFQGIQIRRFKNILPYKIKYYGFGRFLKSKYLRILVAIFDLFAAIPIIWKLQRQNPFQIIHASFILPFGLAGLVIKKFLNIALIITMHGPADFYEVPSLFNPVLRIVLNHADAVVTVSPKLKKDLINRLGNLPIKVINNGVSLIPFKNTVKQELLNQYKIAPNDFVILTAGRLVQRKNLDKLIRAFPKILEKIPQGKLVILGSGIEKLNLQNLVRKLQLESLVIMPGWVFEEKKIEFFKRADIFIQLSEIEGLSLALLESKAAGIPAIIVGSDIPLASVLNEVTGLLIQPPITIEKIIKNIEYLYSKPDLCRKIGYNVIREVEKKYSLEQMVENYIQLYREILRKIR